VPLFWWRARKTVPSSGLRMGVHLLLLALAVQITLGVFTLLQGVPVSLAAAHQAGGLILFTVALYLGNRLIKL